MKIAPEKKEKKMAEDECLPDNEAESYGRVKDIDETDEEEKEEKMSRNESLPHDEHCKAETDALVKMRHMRQKMCCLERAGPQTASSYLRMNSSLYQRPPTHGTCFSHCQILTMIFLCLYNDGFLKKNNKDCSFDPDDVHSMFLHSYSRLIEPLFILFQQTFLERCLE